MTTPQTPVDALMALVEEYSKRARAPLTQESVERAVETWNAIEASARALAAIPEPKRCPYCDDTGDVHSIDGEWRGRCTCPAGQYAPTPPTAPAQDAQGERNAQMLIDIGNAALRAGWNGVDLQAFVIGRLASPSPSAVQPLSEAQIEVLRFLDGVGGLRGFHFGEKPPTERGNYWWRKDLRAAFPEVDFAIVTPKDPT